MKAEAVCARANSRNTMHARERCAAFSVTLCDAPPQPFLTKYFEEMARLKTAKPDLQKLFVTANKPERALESKMTQAEILARALKR